MSYGDFDFQIKEIRLVHRNTHIHDFRWNNYKSLRGVDGLVFCVGGRAQYRLKEKGFCLSAGEAVFLSSSDAYTLRCESDEPFVHYTVNFKLDSVVCDNSLIQDIINGKQHIPDRHCRALYAPKFDALLTIWQNKQVGWQIAARAVLGELLHLYFLSVLSTTKAESRYEKLLPAQKAIEQDPTNNHTVGELAALCHLGETHFRRLFTEEFGMSPTLYRENKRILLAKKLLASGEYTVSETAKRSGFSDSGYFSRLFKKLTGLSPSNFMKL